MIGLWLRIVNVKSNDGTYSLGQGLIAVYVIACASNQSTNGKLSIAETNIGIACACAPSLATFFRRHPVGNTYKQLRAKIWKHSSPGSDLERMHGSSSQEKRLETRILASAVGAEGKFLKSGDFGSVIGKA